MQLLLFGQHSNHKLHLINLANIYCSKYDSVIKKQKLPVLYALCVTFRELQYQYVLEQVLTTGPSHKQHIKYKPWTTKNLSVCADVEQYQHDNVSTFPPHTSDEGHS